MARVRALDIPPEINSTNLATRFDSVFDNEDAMLSTASAESGRFRVVQVELTKWKGPRFEELAITEPQRLINLLTSNTLAFHDLTFAAEAAGRIRSQASVEALLGLLKHHSPLVREGAVYGLSTIVDRDWVRMHLEYLAKHDPVSGVREAAAEALSQ